MIIRFAVFEGSIHNEDIHGFKKAITKNVIPLWNAMPNVCNVSVSFEVKRDNGAPSFPMVAALTYPDLESMQVALDSKEREETKKETERILAIFFKGTLHHHVMEST